MTESASLGVNEGQVIRTWVFLLDFGVETIEVFMLEKLEFPANHIIGLSSILNLMSCQFQCLVEKPFVSGFLVIS